MFKKSGLFIRNQKYEINPSGLLKNKDYWNHIDKSLHVCKVLNNLNATFSDIYQLWTDTISTIRETIYEAKKIRSAAKFDLGLKSFGNEDSQRKSFT